jgi:enoyl-CoA hydratase
VSVKVRDKIKLPRKPLTNLHAVTLNRIKALNAINTPLINELNTALLEFESHPEIRAIILTGSERVFSAGSDIKEMATLTFPQVYTTSYIESWSNLTTVLTKPLIAAVSGYALGGGCELALMADILYCTKMANFGQPEIKLGTIPGAGGSQRLTRAVGKARAMDLILTGRNFDGVEAEQWGAAARTFDTWDDLMDGALRTAESIASYSAVAVKAAKKVVNKSQELSLREGVEYERKLFHALFGSQDQKIGMKAFVDKTNPVWLHQ